MDCGVLDCRVALVGRMTDPEFIECMIAMGALIEERNAAVAAVHQYQKEQLIMATLILRYQERIAADEQLQGRLYPGSDEVFDETLP